MSKILIKQEWNKREIIHLSKEQFDEIIEGESKEYDEEERETEFYDLNKGYEDIQLVVKRLQDDKYFLFEYSHSEDGVLTEFPLTGKEVFKREIITEIYE